MAKTLSVHASDEIASDAAEQAAIGGASPLQAALSAFFAAAGTEPSVLLGPLVILLSGYGANRAFDGRVRQPGFGAKRPRGFLEGQAIPDAARVGIPMSVTAAFIALAYDRTHSLAFPTRYGIAAAKRLGAAQRAELLERLSRLGAGAFKDRQISGPLLHAAGPSEQGLLTAADFDQPPHVDHACRIERHGDSQSVSAPWQQDDAVWETVRVADRQGVAVALAYQRHSRGVEVPEWELLAPLCAAPVLRGVPRVSPGTPRGGSPRLTITLGSDGVATQIRVEDENTEQIVVQRPRSG